MNLQVSAGTDEGCPSCQKNGIGLITADRMLSWENMSMSMENENQPVSGLARVLFSWLLGLSLLPLTIVWIIKYNDTKQSIIENRHDELATVTTMLSHQISHYFETVSDNLFFHTSKANDFLGEINRVKIEYSVGIQEVLNSKEYEKLIELYGPGLFDVLKFYNYSNILIGDKDGNIVYSSYPLSNFGENIYSDDFEKTEFSIAARKALKDNVYVYTDYNNSAEEAEQKLSLLVVPVVDNNQKQSGFIASEFSANEDISSVFNSSLKMSDDVKAYVVDNNKKARFYSYDQKFPNYPLQTDVVEEWLTHIDESGIYQNDVEYDIYGVHDHDHGEHSAKERSHTMVYQNWENTKVIGASRNIEIFGTNMLVLAEMDYTMAMMPANDFRDKLIYIIGITSLFVFFIAGLITRNIVAPIQIMTRWANQVASGHYTNEQDIKSNNEIGELFKSFQIMTSRLKEANEINKNRSWYQDGIAQLNTIVRGEQSITELCNNIITKLCRYIDIPMGAIYVVNDDNRFVMTGSFSISGDQAKSDSFAKGEGLPGQVAMEKEGILLQAPEDFFSIRSGLGHGKANYVYLIPVTYDNEVYAVIELALIDKLANAHKNFLNDASEIIAIAVLTALSKETVHKLLEKTTRQAEELQKQQTELRVANEELEHQTDILRESQEELQARSDELERANVELEEKSESLIHQKEEIEYKNREIESARVAIERKAEELEQAGKYKLEFLANMSHELRTPLNSMLILSRILVDNENENLDEEEVKSAQIIQNVGYDLLNLINEILDLSKVEAGQMEAHLEQVSLESLVEKMNNQFQPVAKDRGITFEIIAEVDANLDFETDEQRVMQILKNLLSNAFKFTEQGTVSVTISQTPSSINFASKELQEYGALCFSVKDSGIGILKDKQEAIFAAFQQADGSTSRKYGGTGLGLSIAREMSMLLGGEMHLQSEEGKGATFSLLLPAKIIASSHQSATTAQPHSLSSRSDYEFQKPQDKVNDQHTLHGEHPILIVEDDTQFAQVLQRLTLSNGGDSVIATTGKEALTLTHHIQPLAIILDLGLPDMDGKDVLKALKANPDTMNIPVHVISGRDRDDSLFPLGVVEYLTKPVKNEDLKYLFSRFTEKSKNKDSKKQTGKILVIDPDKATVEHVREVLGGQHDILYAETAASARELMANNTVSNIIIELMLPDESGDILLTSLKQQLGDAMPAVIINTAEPIDRESYKALGTVSCSMVIKDQDCSIDRLQDEVALFVHSVTDPVEKRKKPAAPPCNSNEQLKGRSILLVDDDLRNTFALSKALQKYEMEIILADNGELALQQLEEHDVDLVLMDIMMPVMDGYEATKRIRQMPRFASLPIIALTAKAMVEDREKCLQMGASDYLTKPVDVDKLVAMMKVWLQA